MTCFIWGDLSNPLALIGAFSAVGVLRQLIIFSCTVRWLWACGIGSFFRWGWSGFSQTIFVIWWWSPSSVLGSNRGRTLWRIACPLCCGLCGERGTLGFLSTLGGCQSWCGSFLFLFGLIVHTFLNPILWA